ncbi:hypothetical protein K7B09_01000 [Thermomonas sp. RSS23]|jgi:hypothetical protein|uniref:Uncharacterized protein n=1 Tax=Thermomonas beijingensis TaxID=2872701 RepID=A0ABS7TAM3_9GAMM|nr:hypothetical protein [Thermomonas beijingensis]MBZ4184901.1 hypothetical protein [Thermomonas beijingensis]
MSTSLQPRPCAALLGGLLLVALGNTHATDGEQVYTGTLGKQTIVMGLTLSDEDAPARYFYQRHHLDIPLFAGKLGKTHLELVEGVDESAPRPVITLDRQANGSWQGIWRGTDGKTLPLSLHPATPTPPASDAVPYLHKLYRDDPYGYLRLADLKLQAGRKQTVMGYHLQWWQQPAAKLAMFEITDGYPEAERQRINAILRNRLWQETDAYFECMGSARGTDLADFEQTVTPELFTPHLISVTVHTDYYCGGAHPDFGTAGINLDVHTGKPIALEDLLWLGKGKPLHVIGLADDPAQTPNAQDNDALAAYQEKTLAPWLLAQFNRLYPTLMQPTDSEDECNYNDVEFWQYGNWHLTPAGVFFGPSFPRAARACEASDDWSIVPWALVRKHPGPLGNAIP